VNFKYYYDHYLSFKTCKGGLFEKFLRLSLWLWGMALVFNAIEFFLVLFGVIE